MTKDKEEKFILRIILRLNDRFITDQKTGL
ncbi:MAG: hypothetical protein RLZZ419_991 [Pseudomonadota bacterium]|jgi:hypothetical protein